MDINQAIQNALEGNAILFTGAGFSYGATNINNTTFITGEALRDYLANECNITETKSSLSSVADYHIKYHKSCEPLINTLTNLFSVKDITDTHKTIMSIKWKRVYTTNYDEVAEIASAQNNYFLKPVTLSSECTNPASQNVCIHINGYIKNLTEFTLMKEFKLSDTSYDSEILKGKPWFDFMEKDFLSAKSIIIGFSLSGDIDISRILSVPAISSKIVFINKPNMDPIDKNVLEKYAPVYEIGIEKFANEIININKSYVPSPITNTCFESFIFEHMQAESPDTTTLKDLTHFYSFGKLHDTLFSKDISGEYKYLAPRKALDIMLRNLYSKKVFLAISTLGNGKTVFCNMARFYLNQIDINIYTFYDQLVDIEFEISEICKSKKKSIVIIDDYYKHMDILKCFYIYGCTNISFILTSRQSKLATNYRKLIDTLHICESDIQPLYLYSLVDDEPLKLANVLSDNKLLPENLGTKNPLEIAKYFTNDCKNSIANIVLDLYNNSDISNHLTDLVNSATSEEGSAIHDLCILALSSAVMNLGLSFSNMLSLLNIDYIYLSYKNSSLLNELFNINKDTVEITSSIIAKTLLYSIIPASELVQILQKVVMASDKLYSHDQKYQELLKAILSHTNFEKKIKNNSANLNSVMKFYDTIRNCNFCKENPFYWEQFASICIEVQDYITAKQCIESAYSCAKKIKGFTPFQISTIEGEMLLKELLQKLSIKNVDIDICINTIVQSHKLFLQYYAHPENNHYHIFNCSQNYLIIYSKIETQMSTRHLSIFIEKLTEVYKKLTEYQNSAEGKLFPSTTKWSLHIEQCLNHAKQKLKSFK